MALDILQMTNPYGETIKMIANLRHDMVNHLQVLHAYAKLNRNEKILEYIETIAREYQMHSRLSNTGSPRIATNLIAMMLRFPELQIDYYRNDERTSLIEHTQLDEDQLIDVILSTAIVMASQETSLQKITLVITIIKPKKGKRKKLLFTMYGTMLEEQKNSVSCLRQRLSKYNIQLRRAHQDPEVFEWELLFT